VAGLARDQFPCTGIAIDSGAYRASQRQADSLLALLEAWIIPAKDQVIVAAIDSLHRSNADRLDRPLPYGHHISWLSAPKEFGDNLQSLRAVLRQQPPILKIVEDSAKIYLTERAAADARDREKHYHSLYATNETKLEALHRKLRWAIIVPWWVLLLLASALVAGFRFRQVLMGLFK
jgi:hypothetical protein